MLNAVGELASAVGTQAACRALGVSRATIYRRRRPCPPRAPRPRPARALSETECHGILAELHHPRFVDLAPAEVYAILLDEGRYLCSLRTMYRVLAAAQEVRERRNQLRHVAPKPELLATRPNEVWSWDIAARPGEVDLLLPLRDPRHHLQPLRGRLDGGASGERRVGGAADRGDL